jgi:hypothetical protein
VGQVYEQGSHRVTSLVVSVVRGSTTRGARGIRATRPQRYRSARTCSFLQASRALRSYHRHRPTIRRRSPLTCWCVHSRTCCHISRHNSHAHTSQSHTRTRAVRASARLWRCRLGDTLLTHECECQRYDQRGNSYTVCTRLRGLRQPSSQPGDPLFSFRFGRPL